MNDPVNSRLPSPGFWRDQRVFLTGHTGFKGGWAALWLRMLGAEVCGFASARSTQPSFFDALQLVGEVQSTVGDIRDFNAVSVAFEQFKPTVVLHMAAQPLVRASYADPAGTFSTNIIGTVHVLELLRTRPVLGAAVVTTNKCFAPSERTGPIAEFTRPGDFDPYSASKGCAELVIASYWWSYFSDGARGRLGSVRSSNLFGGGDWSKDRLIPDLVAAFASERSGILRRPESIRPWQHVLEAVSGYLLAIERLVEGPLHPEPPAWSFAPDEYEEIDVRSMAEMLAEHWGGRARVEVQRDGDAPLEVDRLATDSMTARRELDWRPRWTLREGLNMTVDWYRAYYAHQDVRRLSEDQILRYVDA